MGEADEWYRLLQPYLVAKRANSRGEWRTRCPLHDDDHPSASTNFDKGVFHCEVCGGSSLRQLVQRIKEGTVDDEDDGEADYDPFEALDMEAFREKKAARQSGNEVLSDAKVLGYHEALMADEAVLKEFQKKRGLELGTIQAFKLGWDRTAKRITIPIYDAKGLLVNIRRYLMDADSGQKMKNAMGHGSPPRLYPMSSLDHDDVLVVEGELDALVAIQHGFHAVSGTGGALRWDQGWSKAFEGKRVLVSYDNDKDGRKGAAQVARSLTRVAASIAVLPALTPDEKSDLTDYFNEGGTADGLRQIIAEGAQEKKTATQVEALEPVECRVIGTMDSTTNGKPLTLMATVVGKKGPTYSVPARATVTCTISAGTRCLVCPMAEANGEMEVEISARDAESIARFIDVPEDKRVKVLKKKVGAIECMYFKVEEISEQHSVEELVVMGSVDQANTEEADYTQRRVYNVGSFETPMNTVCRISGTTWPSPKDGRNEFFSWKLEPSITSIDSFEMTPELHARLRVFQTKKGQDPIDKCMDIARDLSENITGIYGRERMHVAMDLVFHSALGFNFNGKRMSRGWLEFIVVGDTRTGKSDTALHLRNHYGLGHIIGCESATFAGLVGGVKQTDKAWSITWGEIPINDRRLVVLDEASGLSQDIIGQLSDIRSRGIAQLTKVESAQVSARARMIWISNPRKSKFVDEKRTEGIDILQDLIGNPEDIARFDFAMSVRMEDVPNEKINSYHTSKTPHVFTSELCHQLVLWCWSRKSEDIIIDREASEAVFRVATQLGKVYVGDPPLVQSQNVREKVLRVAVAIAQRTYSTEDGKHVLVQERHVMAAAKFLHKLYSYDNFGYYRLSRRMRRNREIARKSKADVRKWLRERSRLVEFLLDRRASSFRSQDLEEMAGMDRDDVTECLNFLSARKMIGKDKSQIILERELQELLKEFEQ